ncbi:MAG: phosphatidylinositol kinase [Actinomycetales bacterium]|nr:MAG: phosphatidylinositol kinase [Actinomycetales bacterium]
MDGPTDAEARERCYALLRDGDVQVVGRVVDASNLALLVDVVGADGPAVPAIYKPVRGERPLWDFPTGTLAGREVASARIAEATGYAVVPPTVLRDGPAGVGSVQLWIGDPLADEPLPSPVGLAPAGTVPEGYLSIIDGELPDGTTVTVVHEDADDVRDAAVLDAVLNNSDRKGGHLVRDGAGTLWGFDHGLTLHAEPKLRTVLWGWAGQPLREHDIVVLDELANQLADSEAPLTRELSTLLPTEDLAALRSRVQRLLLRGVHPLPSPGWPSIPWPAL